MTTSQDSVVRTFDVPTGQLVDAFRTRAVATSLTFSPTGDFLATTHVDSVGIYLWWASFTGRVNRTSADSAISTGRIVRNSPTSRSWRLSRRMDSKTWHYPPFKVSMPMPVSLIRLPSLIQPPS